jgi:hypothetical protein
MRDDDLRERLLSNCVERDGPLDTPCLEWAGARDKDGYGRIWVSERGDFRTHRLSFELFVGPIPTELWVLHRCDNPPARSRSLAVPTDPQ